MCHITGVRRVLYNRRRLTVFDIPVKRTVFLTAIASVLHNSHAVLLGIPEKKPSSRTGSSVIGFQIDGLLTEKSEIQKNISAQFCNS